jgi:Tol biopolymer transport system component
MGEVFRARDTRLNRAVAIKFLTAALGDAVSISRFKQEAQAASSLNHPHIMTVFEAGEIDGRHYLVTELLEGGTLKDWARVEHTWRQIVDLLVGVADGLAAAHGAGILHRDIKPDNILLTKNGYAKIADFGLAKLCDPSTTDVTRLTVRHTHPGIVVGTIAYMSPEQASGKPVDERSDIFAFGIVLHELLARGRPFRGKSDLEVLQTIMHGEPEPLPAQIPTALRLIVEKTLEKDPAERYQSARELVIDLRRVARHTTSGAVVPALPTPTRPLKPLPWIAAAVFAAALAGSLALRPRSIPDNVLATARFTRLTDFDGAETDAAISPDGKWFAFVSDRDGPLDIWLSQIGTGRFVNLTHGREAALRTTIRSVGFSADGAQVWFHNADPETSIRTIPLMGGDPRVFIGKQSQNAAWTIDGRRLVYHTSDSGDPMFVADAVGGNARQIFVAPPGIHNHFPAWSTDGKWIYFVSGSPGINQLDIWRVPSDGGAAERLTEQSSVVGYVTPLDPDTILYVGRDSDGSGPWLWELEPEKKRNRRVSFGLEKYTSLAASSDARRLVASVADPRAQLWTVPISEKVAVDSDAKPMALPRVRALAPRFGDSALFFLSSSGSGDGLWRLDADQAVEIWKGSDGALLEPAAVSSDGRRVAFVLRQNGKIAIKMQESDGTDLRTVSERIQIQGAADWSPDGKWIVVGGSDSQGPGLFKLPVGGGDPVRLVTGPAANPAWSRDGTMIAYAGPNVGAYSPLLMVRSDGAKIDLPAINVERDGERFRFLPDSRSIVYMQGVGSGPQDFWVLNLATKIPRRLTRLNDSARMRTFDLTPDGKQIVFDRLRENSDIVLLDLK